MGTATPSAEGRRRLLLPAAVLGASALLLTACGQAPEASNSSESAGSASATGAAAEVGSDNSDSTGCIVSDEGGFDDRSFNQSSYEGLKAAEEEFGIEIREAESNSVGEYVPNLNAMLDADCNLVVAVGFQLGDTMKPIAEENAETKFVGVDVTAPGFPENVRNIIYDIPVGLSYEWRNIMLNATYRYEIRQAISQKVNNYGFGSNAMTARNHAIIITLGYRFKL